MKYDDNSTLMWVDIDASIHQLYDYYESTYENKQSFSSSQTSSSSKNKRYKTSDTINELHYYIQRVATPEIDPDSGFDNFDILA